MGSETQRSKVWMRFEAKKQDGSIIKLRIQDLPKYRMEDFFKFYTTYFIKDESFHKAAGIYKSQEAIEDYIKVLAELYESNPPDIAMCCLDSESEEFNEILAVSAVQVETKERVVEDDFKEIDAALQTKEAKALFHILLALLPKFPNTLKEKYKTYYGGRGIIVRPDYRGLGIASQFVKQRRLLCQEYKVPMTCAWMTSIGSQKAAEKNGWKTMVEITLEELDKLTGLVFAKDVPTYKLMVATENV